MAKNAYAKELQKRKQLQVEIIQDWMGQLCLDVMTLVLNDPDVMGKNVMGKGRLKKIGEAFNRYMNECSLSLTKDVEASYIREKIDARLIEIWGEDFKKWPERYTYWDDRGI